MPQPSEQDAPRNRLKILVYGINYAPELTGIGKYTGEMADWLAGRGHDVRVVTAPPYYPAWRIGDGYKRWSYSRQRLGGVDVWRAPMYVPGKPGGLNRIVHLVSYSISSIPLLLRQIRWKPDVVWVAQPTLFCVPGALALTRVTRSRRWIHVQDFEVNAGFGLGLMKGSFLRSVVLKFETWLFKRFDRISTISPNMSALASFKTGRDDIVLFPNWVDTSLIRPLNRPSKFRQKLGISNDETVLLYSGVMGHKQGLAVLADAARALKSETMLQFVFCGNGPGRVALERACAGLENVRFLDLQPAEQLGELLGLADVHLLPQRADVNDLVMPSKLTGMLASGRPIIATVAENSSLADMVQGSGLVVDPEDPAALVQAIRRLASDSGLRRSMGHAGRDKAHRYLSREAVLRNFEAGLQELCAPAGDTLMRSDDLTGAEQQSRTAEVAVPHSRPQ